jgi:hypothetical protein
MINFSTHFENTHLQQTIDIAKKDNDIFNEFVGALLSKYFKGRDLIIRNQDIRYLIKNTLSQTGVSYYLTRLLGFMITKESGGARTAHQINQVKEFFKLGV